MFKKFTAINLMAALVITFGLFLHSGGGSNFKLISDAAASEDFSAVWEAAEAERKAAAKLGFEWRDTKKILKKAKAAHEAGEGEKAMKLAAQAHEQASDAIAQQAREATAWQSRVPK